MVGLIREQYPGTWPLGFGGAELYQGDNDRLLGRGVALLCDLPDNNRVGEYWFFFYGEDEVQVLDLPICPRMKFIREAADVHPAARRMSVDGCDADAFGSVISLSVPGHPPYE